MLRVSVELAGHLGAEYNQLLLHSNEDQRLMGKATTAAVVGGGTAGAGAGKGQGGGGATQLEQSARSWREPCKERAETVQSLG